MQVRLLRRSDLRPTRISGCGWAEVEDLRIPLRCVSGADRSL